MNNKMKKKKYYTSSITVGSRSIKTALKIHIIKIDLTRDKKDNGIGYA